MTPLAPLKSNRMKASIVLHTFYRTKHVRRNIFVHISKTHSIGSLLSDLVTHLNYRTFDRFMVPNATFYGGKHVSPLPVTNTDFWSESSNICKVLCKANEAIHPGSLVTISTIQAHIMNFKSYLQNVIICNL